VLCYTFFMIKIVILDFDDTLCLTEKACFNIENEIAVDMGFFPMNRKTHQKNWGSPIRKAIAQRIPGIDVNEFMKRQERVVADYVKSGKLDIVPEKNLKILDELKEKGKKIAILTSRSLPEVQHLLHKTHPLNNRVEIIFHKDNSEYLKPDPRSFNQILHHFDAQPDECIYVGDSIGDAIASKGAGLHFIAILENGLLTKRDFINQNVDFFADKFSSIADYIICNDHEKSEGR
jgi:phosphoglycolate phosphatase